MTARVIRTMQFDEQEIHDDVAFLKNVGPGLLVTLDAEQRLDAEGNRHSRSRWAVWLEFVVQMAP